MNSAKAKAAPPLPSVTVGEDHGQRFRGRSVMVTGAGNGIGRAVALRLAAEGASVIAADIDLPAAQKTVSMMGSAIPSWAVEVDVRNEHSVAALADAGDHFAGGVDVLVNNAGIELLGTVEEMAPSVWDEVMAVNLRGPYLVSRAVLGQLIRSAGVRGEASIVNNASLMGLVSSAGLAAYCASKAGLVSLTRSMALDLAPQKVRVNCVCPGIIHTSMLERRFDLSANRDAAYLATSQRPPLHYLGRPEDVAAAIAYLGADESRFVTGSALTIDGGVGAE